MKMKNLKVSMERFLNDCDDKDNKPELVKKEEVVEEIGLVTIVNPKANHENVEVIIETNNNLQFENQIEKLPSEEERIELKIPKQNDIVERRNRLVVVEEIDLVTIIDPKANHEKDEVFFETNNDLLTVEKRGE